MRLERKAVALLLAALLHGLLLLAGQFYATSKAGFSHDQVMHISLMPELLVPSPPTPLATPPRKPTARPLSSIPPKAGAEKAEAREDMQRAEKTEVPDDEKRTDMAAGKEQPPPKPPSSERPQKKMTTDSQPPPAAAGGDTASPPRPVPSAAPASAQPQQKEKHLEKSSSSSPPTAIHAPPPEYPQRARSRGWQGTVLVEVLIDPAGKVREARLVASSGHKILDRAALKEIKNWRFRPGRQDGQNAAMHVRIPIRFQLDNRSSG